VPALVLVMQKDSYGTARSQAALALGNIGPGARSAVPSLMEALSDKTLVEAAAAALDKIGEGAAAAKRLTSVVKDTTARPGARGAAIMGLKHAGDRKAAVALMIAIIEDKAAVPEVRRSATLAVGHIGFAGGEEAKSAVPALLANLDHPDVCHSGPWSLWALGATDQAVPRLTALLAHRDPQLKAQAASGLVHMAGGNPPPEAKAAVPALITALKTKDDARTAVISALGDIGPDAKAAVPALMALLKDDDQWTRDRANEAIKKIAPNP
jgi:HEAT repeat protein